MTREEVVEVLEKHLKCIDNKQCLWDITHSCDACEFFTTDEDWMQAESHAIKALQERKTGKWIDGHCMCSICKWYPTNRYGFAVRADYNYCPNCGAKMEAAE